MSLSIPFPFWVAAEQKGGQDCGYYIASLPSLGKRIILHPWPFISDIAVFVLKRDVKFQSTNRPMELVFMWLCYSCYLQSSAFSKQTATAGVMVGGCINCLAASQAGL